MELKMTSVLCSSGHTCHNCWQPRCGEKQISVCEADGRHTGARATPASNWIVAFSATWQLSSVSQHHRRWDLRAVKTPSCRKQICYIAVNHVIHKVTFYKGGQAGEEMRRPGTRPHLIMSVGASPGRNRKVCKWMRWYCEHCTCVCEPHWTMSASSISCKFVKGPNLDTFFFVPDNRGDVLHN